MLEDQGLVGRGWERRALDQLVERVVAGRGGVVTLVGEPGIGKSELADYVARSASELGCAVGWGRCRETAGGPPFWPWMQVLKALGPDSWEDLAAGADSRFAVFESVAEMLRQRAGSSPVLVILDDVHAADEASMDLLMFLVAQVLPARVGFVVTARTDSHAWPTGATELARSQDGARIDLRGLSSDDVRTWLEREGLGGADAEEVFARSGGNPFFVREVVRLMLSGVREVPSAVRDVVRERVGQLPESSRMTLAAAAVLGRDFGVPALAAMLETSPDRLEADLAAPFAAQLVARAVDGAPGRYRFAHALTQEVVEADVEPGERIRLHARALAVLPFTGVVEPSALAAHALSSPGWVAADVVWETTVDAARDADRRMAWEDAARWWRAALDAAGSAGVENHQWCQAWLALGRAELRCGRVDRAREAFVSVATRALSRGNVRLAAESVLAVGETVAEIGPDAELLALLDEALGLPALPAADRVRLQARRAIATYWLPGGTATARRMSQEAEELARESPDRAALAAAFVARVFTLRGPDDLELRLTVGEDALSVAGRLKDPSLRFRACQWVIPDRFQAGDLAGVREAVAGAEGIAAVTRDPLQRWWLLIWRCLLAGFHGEDDVTALADEGGRLGRVLRQQAADTYAFAASFPLQRRAGRLGDLEPALRDLIGRFPGLPTLECNLSLLCAETGRPDDARRLLDRLSRSALAALPRDALFLASVAILIETCVSLGDADRVQPLLPHLEPYAERNLIQGVPVGWGAAAWYLARGAHLRGDAPTARRYAQQAQALHARWGARAWGHPLHDLPGNSASGPLSHRERDVLAHLAAGRTNKDIATTLHLSVHTVERHIANIFLKLGTRTRSEATAWAHRNGLAPRP